MKGRRAMKRWKSEMTKVKRQIELYMLELIKSFNLINRLANSSTWVILPMKVPWSRPRAPLMARTRIADLFNKKML